MIPILVLLVGLLLLLAAAGTGYALGRSSAVRQDLDAATVDRVRREVLALRALVARLKDIAWDQRELDPSLSTIVIDEIRTHEKRELEG